MAKKLVFFGKSNYLYSKQWCESCVRDFLVTFSLFIRQKVFVKENVGIIGHACESRLPDCSKLTINWKNDDGIIICWHGVIVKLFWRCRVSLVGFSYWFKFHVNITTDSGVMTNLAWNLIPNLIPNLAWKSLLKSYLMLKNPLPSPPTSPPSHALQLRLGLRFNWKS